MKNFTNSKFDKVDKNSSSTNKKSFIENLLTIPKLGLLLVIGIFLLTSTHLNAQTVTVATDKTDYSPGEFAYASGNGWSVGSVITLTVNDETDPAIIDVITSTIADDGSFANVKVYEFFEIHLEHSFTLTASDGVSYAVTHFTDGAPDIEAWHNLNSQWSGGTTVQQSNSKYSEGEVLPFQYTQPDGNPAPILLNGETYDIVLRWDFSADPIGSGYFIDYIEAYDKTESGVTPFDEFTGGFANSKWEVLSYE
jgi:hypothetical protein